MPALQLARFAHHSPMATFAEQLKEARAALGYSKPRMAAALGIKLRTLYEWEDPPAKRREQLAVTQEGALARIAVLMKSREIDPGTGKKKGK